MSEAVEGLARAIPSDMDQEKAMLVLAMVLTKKIANTMPSLLRRAFNTTVNYISQEFHNYIARMVSAGNGSPYLLREEWLRGSCHSFCLPHSQQLMNKGAEKRDVIALFLPAVSSGSYALQTG